MKTRHGFMEKLSVIKESKEKEKTILDAIGPILDSVDTMVIYLKDHKQDKTPMSYDLVNQLFGATIIEVPKTTTAQIKIMLGKLIEDKPKQIGE